MTTILEFQVIGTPAPQGSKRFVGNGRMVESSKALPGWRQAMTHIAHKAALDCGWTVPKAAGLDVTFWFKRPKHHYRTGRNAHLLREGAPSYHTTKPDVDKLQRALFDSLASAGVVQDDSHVARVFARKMYSDDLLERPEGASVSVWAMNDADGAA